MVLVIFLMWLKWFMGMWMLCWVTWVGLLANSVRSAGVSIGPRHSVLTRILCLVRWILRSCESVSMPA